MRISHSIVTTIPRRCHIWQADRPTKESLYQDLEIIETYDDDSQFIQQLRKCAECGQLYFYELFEMIDWTNGADAQYRTLIPIPNAEAAHLLIALKTPGAYKLSPRLVSHWPSGQKEPRVYWVRRASK